MKLTVLGKYGPFPAPGGACSGYLVEAPGARILLDMGSGIYSRLVSISSLIGLDAILLSHLHADHMSDMLILRHALQTLPLKGTPVPTPLSLAAPSLPELEFRQLSSAGVFDMIYLHNGLKLRFGTLTVTFHSMIHSIPTYAMEIVEDKQPGIPPKPGTLPLTAKLVYTGDTGLHNKLYSICEGADMLLADTCLLNGEKTTSYTPHMTAREAAELARDSGVKKLLCTHLWGGCPEDRILQEAAAVFPESQVAQEMHSYII